MLEKNNYFISLKNKEVTKKSNLTEAQYEILATKSEIKRLQTYLTVCKEHEEEEIRSMLNPFVSIDNEEQIIQYNENLNTILNMIYDLGTKETRAGIVAI